MAIRQVDPRDKSNLDRVERNKMNTLRRVRDLPARGRLGDWAVRLERHTIGEEVVELEQAYAWVEGEWVAIGGLGNLVGRDTDVNFLDEV